VYNFITDQDFNLGILDTTTLNVPTSGKKAGKVVSSQPGQFSDNVLIANTCVMDQSFDLKISLDDSFTTNPSGNPGNAVFTYASGGEFDSSDFSELLAGEGTPNHENLCLQKVTVPAGSSFLATVHSGIKDSWPKTSLPADDSFDFAATLYHGVNLGCTGAPEMLAAPNPAKFVLPFTLK
jgi:hypothetical protein